MPTNEFEENRSFLHSAQSEGIDKEAFQKFVEQYGPEVTKGYLMAFQDLLPEIEDIHGTPNNVQKRKMAWALLVHMRGLLQLHSDLNSSANMQAPKL